MRELRALTDRLRQVFERAGYGEVYTPALEYESPLAPNQEHPEWTGPRPAYRVFDEHGNVLALRSDMTIPIARLAATRYRDVDPPLRFCYFAHAYRRVRPQRGQSRELLQAGIELIGPARPKARPRYSPSSATRWTPPGFARIASGSATPRSIPGSWRPLEWTLTRGSESSRTWSRETSWGSSGRFTLRAPARRALAALERCSYPRWTPSAGRPLRRS